MDRTRDTSSSPSSPPLYGIACALIGAALWGVSGVCIQFVQQGYGLDSAFITCARDGVAAGLFLLLLAALKRHRPVVLKILHDARALGNMALFGFFLFACQITYALAIEHTNASTGTVMQSLSIALIMVVSCIRSQRPPTLIEGIGLAFALISTWLIATQGDPGALHLSPSGLIWGLTTAITAALYIMYPVRLYARYGSFITIACGFSAAAVIATLCWIFVALMSSSPFLPPLDAAGLCGLVGGVGLLGTFIAFGLYLFGIAKIGPVLGGILGAAEPVSASVVMALWLATPLSPFDWTGLCLMVAMIVLVSLAKRR